MMSFEKDGVIHRYSLQHMNRSVFKNPVTLMNNILQVTDYLKEQIKNRVEIHREKRWILYGQKRGNLILLTALENIGELIIMWKMHMRWKK